MKKKIPGMVLCAALVAGLLQLLPFGPASTATVKAAEEFVTVTPAKITNLDGFLDGLAANPDSMGSSSISAISDKEATKTYFTFTLPENGIVQLRFSIKDDQANDGGYLNSTWAVYMDKGMTNAVSDTITLTENYKDTVVELKKGTYYIECAGDYSPWTKGLKPTNTIGASIAYIPLKVSTSNYDVQVSTTETTSDDVVVTIDTDDAATVVYMLPESVDISFLNNEFEWDGKTMLPGKTFTVTKNGSYTVRIETRFGKHFQKVININNIDNTRPTTPTFISCKAGSTNVKGKADAGTQVNIVIGSKTYTGIARDNGVYSIKVAKLAKGTKIKANAKDYAGNKSDWKSITVK